MSYSQNRNHQTFTLDESLEKLVHDWLARNPNMSVNILVNLAIREFVQKPYVLHPVTAPRSKEPMSRPLGEPLERRHHQIERIK